VLADAVVGAEPQLFLQLQARDVGMGGHEIGRSEPDVKRQLRAVQDRARLATAQSRSYGPPIQTASSPLSSKENM
jgi:hypothetical protein